MSVVQTMLLSGVLDDLNEAEFFALRLPSARRRQAVKFILSRQGEKGSYAGMFAPTAGEFSTGVRLFTGERIRTGAGVGHVLGEEALRALHVWAGHDSHVAGVIEEAEEAMLQRLEASQRRDRNAGRAFTGEFCCGSCSVSLWRTMAAGGFEEAGTQHWLEAGLRSLGGHRTDTGRWRRYPFFYTVLALTEMDLPEAVDELRYAAPALERAARRRDDDPYAIRRRALAARALERI